MKTKNFEYEVIIIPKGHFEDLKNIFRLADKLAKKGEIEKAVLQITYGMQIWADSVMNFNKKVISFKIGK